MSIAKGPFILVWGGNTLVPIEQVEINHDINTDDYESNSGIVYEITKSRKTTVSLTLLETDILALKAVLPQYFKAENEQLADGSFVVDTRGAIDITAEDCDTEPIYEDLSITACNNPEETFKLMHTRTVLENIEIGKIRKIVVKFIGEPNPGQSLMQFVGDQGEDDFFQLGNDELFLLGDGNNLIL